MSDSWNALVTSILLLAYPVVLAVCVWTLCLNALPYDPPLWNACLNKLSFLPHRLAADLSPEESEDSTVSSPSSSSSEEEEEVKLKTYEDNGNNVCPSPTGASPAPSKNAKEIYNQGHTAGHHVSPVNTPSSASATSPRPTRREDQPHTEASQCRNREVNSNQFTECSITTAQPNRPHTASQPSAHVGTATLAHGTATLAHGTKRRADDSVSCSSSSSAVQEARFCRSRDPGVAGGGRESVSDDDNDSVEDVSISHNVPMCPPSPSPLTPSSTSSPYSPRERGVEVAVRGEERGGGASGSWSESADHCGGNKTSHGGLRLQETRRTKYQGPYTLACDVTPSPMQEHTTLANSIARTGNNVSGHVTAAASTPAFQSSGPSSGPSSQLKVPRRPRKLPEIPRKHQGLATASSSHVRSIFDEIQEALIKEATSDEVFPPSPPSSSSPSSSSQERAAQQYPYIHKHVSHLFDKKRLLIGYASSGPARSACRSRETSVSSVTSRSRHVSTSSRGASEAAAAASGEEEEGDERRGDVSVASSRAPPLLLSPSSTAFPSSPSPSSVSSSAVPTVCQQLPRRRQDSEGEGSRRRHSSSCSSVCTLYQEMEVTHRGMHRFIPRHADEVQIGIGDPIHVIREYDDLWCEGVNLRSGERGIFPAMYANDLTFLEDSDGDEEHWKFTMRFLGAVEVTSSSGDFALCQAINKVAQQGRVKTTSLCTLEINQYGIRMIDKSKEGHQSQKFSNFFALKNISFCGTHPNNNRYFAFITKHPKEIRFACHVFHSDRNTHRARDALGNAFKRFYQEYMAFTHPTEDIWIE
ncbi:hypothetical protein ACOMHN_025491 [Nucella lapillus]